MWLAGLAALTVYWPYINLIYTSAPYLTEVFRVSTAMAAAFGIFNTGLVGIFAGVVSGLLADYVFRSSTKMIAVSLAMVVAAAVIVLLLPVSSAMIWPILILLVIVSIATFLAKSVILAPIAELNLPEGISGSAMSVGSFLAFASIFWAYTLNGSVLDANAADPEAGCRFIFMITAGVALVRALAAGSLAVINRRIATKHAILDAQSSQDVS